MSKQFDRETHEERVATIHRLMQGLIAATHVDGFFGGFTVEVSIQDGNINGVEGHTDRRYRPGRLIGQPTIPE